VIQLAHDCVMLEIPVDTGRLYDGDDPYYELWLRTLAQKVEVTKRAQAQQAKQKGRRK
jgi:hypothetical protein